MRAVLASWTWWALLGGCGAPGEVRGPPGAPEASPSEVTAQDPARGPDPPDVSVRQPPTVCVNELSPANRVSALDEAGMASDWIELHNPGDTDVRLDGWSLGDSLDASEARPLSPELRIEAGGFLVLWADGAPERGPTHLGFSLAAEGEVVALFAPDGAADIVHFPAASGDLVIARRQDCCFDPDASCFGFAFAGTPGAPNHVR